MFAFPKLVLLLLVFGALWIFYRWVNNPMRELRAPRPPRSIPAEDLVVCGVCSSYVAVHSPACARRNCPRPR